MRWAATTLRRRQRRSFCSEQSGQASVEAALLLPVLMLCIALLTQPMCLLYTRAVMQSAAAQGCRLLATAQSGAAQDGELEQYVRRRLEAVPQADIFHAGDWRIELSGDSSEGQVGVCITGSVRPLPLVGVVAAMLGPLDASGNVELKVEVSRPARPSWVEGGYHAWLATWDS